MASLIVPGQERRIQTRHPEPDIARRGPLRPCGSPRSWFPTAHPAHASADSAGERGRILVVAPQPFYQDRGTPIALRAVLTALSELGYAADVLTFPLGQTPDIPGVRICRTPNPLGFRSIPIGWSLKKLVLDVLLAGQLRTYLRQDRYLCVHAVEEAAFFAVAVCRPRHVKVLYDMHASLPDQLTLHGAFRCRPIQAVCQRLERWLLSHVQYVACSAGLAPHVRAVAPDVPVHEWHFPSTLPPASPEAVAALRDELRLPPHAPVVLYSGSCASYQGVEVLLEAIPRVVAAVPQAVCVVVGMTQDEPSIWSRAMRDAACAHHVRLLPRQPGDRIACFLALADVLVSPRRHGDNLPLKIFEYLAAGKPIVASDIPAHRAVLDATRAVLVPPSADALAQAIIHVLTDPEYAARLGAAAYAYANARLGWSTFVASVDDIYRAMHAVPRLGMHP